MVGLVLSANLLLIYIFWEITAVCSWRLIGFYRQPQHLRNADTALMMTVFGSFLMLVGLEMIWHETGSLNLNAVHGQTVSNLACSSFSSASWRNPPRCLCRSGCPARAWRPRPSQPCCTRRPGGDRCVRLCSASSWASFTCRWTGRSPLRRWRCHHPGGGGAALMENNAKRILAYSTLGQLGYAYLGLASMNAIGITGGLIYLLAHSLAKAGLFLCVGIIEHKTHTPRSARAGRDAAHHAHHGNHFHLCVLTIVGFPPTAGFFGKLMIFMGSLQSGKTLSLWFWQSWARS